MLKNTFFMSLSLLVRLLASLLLFVILARVWGVETFGTFMYPFVSATLLGLVADYGFTLQLVREVGRDPARAPIATGRALPAKLALTGLVAVAGVAFAAFLPERPGMVAVFGLLLASNLALSLAVFLNLPLRGVERFQDETRVALIGNVVLFAVVSALALQGAGPIPVAAGFLIARIVHLAAAWQAYCGTIGKLKWPSAPLTETWAVLRTGFPFGVHILLGTLYFQIDTLIIQHFLGEAQVGIYQSGMRVLVGGLILTEALANAHLPALARWHAEHERFVALAGDLNRRLLVLGVIGFVCMSAAANLLVEVLYGSEFREAAALLPVMGLVLLIRYVGTGWGLLLTVADKQAMRMFAVTLALILNVGLNFALIPQFGLQGAVSAMVATHIVLHAIYIAFVRAELPNLGLSRRSWVLLALATAYGVWVFAAPAASILTFAGGGIVAAGALVLGVQPREWAALHRQTLGRLATRRLAS